MVILPVNWWPCQYAYPMSGPQSSNSSTYNIYIPHMHITIRNLGIAPGHYFTFFITSGGGGGGGVGVMREQTFSQSLLLTVKKLLFLTSVRPLRKRYMCHLSSSRFHPLSVERLNDDLQNILIRQWRLIFFNALQVFVATISYLFLVKLTSLKCAEKDLTNGRYWKTLLQTSWISLQMICWTEKKVELSVV